MAGRSIGAVRISRKKYEWIHRLRCGNASYGLPFRIDTENSPLLDPGRRLGGGNQRTTCSRERRRYSASSALISTAQSATRVEKRAVEINALLAQGKEGVIQLAR